MKLERLNPAVKAGTCLVCVILLSFQYLVSLNLAVFLLSVVLLAVCSQVRLGQVLKLLTPAFVAAFGLFVTGFFHGNGAQTADLQRIAAMPYAVRAAMSAGVYPALQLSTRLLAYAGFGMLFVLSTEGEAFIFSLMHQCRLKPKFAYGILAAVRLMPNMVREFKSVRLAFRARGMQVRWYSLPPVFTMLVNAIRWSQCVAMAMESKGFDGDAPRTHTSVPQVRWYDRVFFFCWVIGIVSGMCLLKY